MKLNLKQVLGLAGIAKPAYDSRRRRDIYGFLHDSLSSDPRIAEYENAHNRWGIEHVVAIQCIEEGAKSGLSLEMADSIVENNFSELVEAIRSGSIDPDSSASASIDHMFVGAIFYAAGRGHYAGTLRLFHDIIIRDISRVDHQGEHFDGSITNVIMIDATTAYRQVKHKLLGGAA
ncbi:hypothetical protein [Sphingomonas fennica]|uniref:hypothetical protein n=1 Tax=Edaphosphingomonas fennica TaxID=114404 RepID=UPI0011B28BCC|nr:hypothetical protein [Sphingomonas fennica]